MNKKIILMILGIFLIVNLMVFVNAEVQTLGTFKQGTQIELKQIYNGTNCNITSVSYPNSTRAITNQQMSKDETEFTYILNTTYTQDLGQYIVNGECGGDVWAYDFYISPLGESMDSAKALIYFGLLLVAVILFALTIIGVLNMETENYYDIGGDLLKVNFAKYLKMFFILIAYQLLVFIFFISWQISENFLYAEFTTGIFHTFFDVLMILEFPFLFLLFVISLFKWLLDIKLHRLSVRGIKPR